MIDAQFEGHIHPGKLVCRRRFASRQIMDRVLRAAYQLDNAIKTTNGVVRVLRGQARIELQVDNAECDRLQDWSKLTIKRAIDED
jgi:hypothetical protein